MSDQINQIPINFGFNPQDAQVLSQIAKDIDLIVKALEKINAQRIIDDKDVNAANALVKRLEELKRKEQEALGIVEKLAAAQKRWRMEVMAARTPEELARAKNELQRVNQELSKAAVATNTWGKALGSFQFKFNALGNIAAMVSSKMWMMSTALVTGLSKGFPIVREYEKSFAAVKSILSEKELTSFEPVLRKASIDAIRDYGLAIEDVNLALYDAISSNVQAAEAPAVLDAAARLAVGGLTDMNTAIKAIVSVINAFNLGMDEALDVAAGYFTAQKYGITYVDEMANSLGRMNTVAALTGTTWQEMEAAFSAITLAGLNTEETVTALRNIFNELANPAKWSADQIKALKSELYGIDVPIGATEMSVKGFIGTMDELKKVFDFYPDKLAQIFGNIRGYTGASALLTDQLFKKFKDVFFEIANEMGNVANLTKAVNDQMQTLQKTTEVATGKWQAFFIEMDNGDGVLSGLARGFQELRGDIAETLRFINKVSQVGFEQARLDVFLEQLTDMKDMGRSFADEWNTMLKANPNENLLSYLPKLNEEIESTTANLEAAKQEFLDFNDPYISEWLSGSDTAMPILGGADAAEATKLAENVAYLQGYYDKLIELRSSFVAQFEELSKDEAEAMKIDLNKLNLAGLEDRLNALNDQLSLMSKMDIGTQEHKDVLLEISQIEQLIANIKGVQNNERKKGNDLERDAMDAIRLRYMIESMRVDVTRYGLNKELELLYLQAKEKEELAQYEIKNNEQRAEYIRLIWDKFYQDVEDLEKKHKDKIKDEVYRDFQEDKQSAEAFNEAYLKELENRLNRELNLSGLAGEERKKQAEENAKQIAAARIGFTLKWANYELDVVKRLYGAESTQAQLLVAQIKLLEAELASLSISTGEEGEGQQGWLAKLLGLTDSDLRDILQMVREVLGAIEDITDAYVQAAEQRTEAIEEEMQASEERMRQLESDRDHEWERMKEGYANNYDLKRRELEDERRRNEKLQVMKEKAMREEERRKNLQIAINTIIQVSNLMVASSEMIKDGGKKGGIIGALLALAAVGAMVAGFMAIKANTQKSLKYRGGGYRDLDGPSHEDGGMDVTHEAEGGEGMSIFNRQANRRYKREIRDFTRAANNGQLLGGWNRLSALSSSPMPQQTIVLSDEYSRKLYELQKETLRKRAIKVVPLGPNRTMIIDGNEIKYITHHAN